jgi:histone H3
MARTKPIPVKNTSTEIVKSESGEKKAKRPHRYRPGTVALREIRRYQKSTELLIKRGPVERLIKEIDQEMSTSSRHMFRKHAISAIHSAAEAYLQTLFTNTIEVSLNAGCQTIRPQDMRLAARMIR